MEREQALRLVQHDRGYTGTTKLGMMVWAARYASSGSIATADAAVAELYQALAEESERQRQAREAARASTMPSVRC